MPKRLYVQTEIPPNSILTFRERKKKAGNSGPLLKLYPIPESSREWESGTSSPKPDLQEERKKTSRAPKGKWGRIKDSGNSGPLLKLYPVPMSSSELKTGTSSPKPASQEGKEETSKKLYPVPMSSSELKTGTSSPKPATQEGKEETSNTPKATVGTVKTTGDSAALLEIVPTSGSSMSTSGTNTPGPGSNMEIKEPFVTSKATAGTVKNTGDAAALLEIASTSGPSMSTSGTNPHGTGSHVENKEPSGTPKSTVGTETNSDKTLRIPVMRKASSRVQTKQPSDKPKELVGVMKDTRYYGTSSRVVLPSESNKLSTETNGASPVKKKQHSEIRDLVMGMMERKRKVYAVLNPTPSKEPVLNPIPSKEPVLNPTPSEEPVLNPTPSTEPVINPTPSTEPVAKKEVRPEILLAVRDLLDRPSPSDPMDPIKLAKLLHIAGVKIAEQFVPLFDSKGANN